MQPLTTEHCGSVHYITIGDIRLLTAAGLTRSPLYLIGDAASRCGLSRVGYFIPLNGRRPLNGHPPSIQLKRCLIRQLEDMERGSSDVERWTLNRHSPGSNPLSCCSETSPFSFSPRRPSSLSCINVYLAEDSDGNVSAVALSNCSVAECFPEKSSWRRNEQVCQGLKCKAI